MNKKTKKPFNLNEEIRRMGVMLEHVDGKVGLLAEQHGSTQQKLDSHTEKLDSHSAKLNKLTMDVAIVKTDIEFIKGSLKTKVDVVH